MVGDICRELVPETNPVITNNTHSCLYTCEVYVRRTVRTLANGSEVGFCVIMFRIFIRGGSCERMRISQFDFDPI